MNLKIALLQLLPEGKLEKQLEKGKNACMKAKNMGADIALFPEMWSDGYKLLQDSLELAALSIDAQSDFVRAFGELAGEGAEVILAPNACPMEINRLSALRTRAYENMLAIATCNYPKGQPDCNGHSTVFDGVAWLSNEPGVRDMCILEAQEEEGIYLAEINMDMLRDYRDREVMGNKYRHPNKYKSLATDIE